MEHVVLNEAARNAFHQLKKAVMIAPVLAYPDPNKEYLLVKDALKLGLGAVLSQKQSNGGYHPVAFGSRALHSVEVNYHSFKLEFLAMKWSACWVAASKFTLIKTLSCTFSPHPTWMPQNKLAKYDFSCKYQKGKNNTMSDALSRISDECLSNEEAEKCLKQSL